MLPQWAVQSVQWLSNLQKTCHVERKMPFLQAKKKKMEETSGRATEEGSLSVDGLIISAVAVVCMEKNNKITVYKLH